MNIVGAIRKGGKSVIGAAHFMWEKTKELLKAATPARALVIPNKPFSQRWMAHFNRVVKQMDTYGRRE